MKKNTKPFLSYGFLIVFSITMLLPFLWMLLTSLKPEGEVFSSGGGILPSTWEWKNYIQVWREIPFFRYLCNSAIVAVVVTVGQVFTSSMAAFAFARLNFPGRDRIFMAYLSTMMIPGTVTMIPVFITLRQLNLLDTYIALVLPGMFSAYGTFMLRQFFLGISSELEEAAVMDGCSLFGIYWHIILPLSKPALATLSIFTFISNWRSFTWPLIVTFSSDRFTLPVGIASFAGQYEINWPLLMAANLMMILPTMLIFIGGQRYFIGGIQLGAVKG